MGHSHQVKSFSRRTRCQGTWQRRHNNLSKQVSSGVQSSSHQKRDGDSAVRDARVDSRIRYTPYTIVPYHQRDSSNKQDQTNVNIERDQKPPEGRMEGNQQDGTLGSWFKITIPFGIKYDKKWLLNLIQSQCSVPFIPVEFHYEKMQAHFFVENASTASALKDMCGKICDENNERIFIFVSPCCVPHAVQKEPKSKEVDQIKLTTNAQYDASQLALDIQRFHIDSDIAKNSNFRADMMTHDADMTPNLRKCVAASLHIHEENMPKPQIESAGEMDKGRGLEPEETYVDRNTLDTAFPDKSSNIKSVVPSCHHLED
ncbi:nuclear RNA export factor 3 [Tupaia chinensis]|uniref:nuclear RNA export factor 3 n=1 Tax=Tupaia chinensis TaxID=246437 RepID=UPI000703DDFA|nr:nuclear RNA export factor 3 [Tupaia chinensis]